MRKLLGLALPVIGSGQQPTLRISDALAQYQSPGASRK